MEITLLTIGKTGISYIQEGIAEYCKRLRRYIPYSILELPDPRRGKLSEQEQKEAEADLLLRQITDGD